MDPNAAPPPAVPEPPTCTICMDPVVAHEHGGARSVALLLCGHTFHLDCIGSEFNTSGFMQCPNCRNIEEGDWLNPNAPSDNEDGDWFNPNVPQPSTDSLTDFLGQSPFDGSAALDYLIQNRQLGPISSGLEGGQTAGLSNVQVFDGREPRNSEIQQHSTQYADQPHSMPLCPGGDQLSPGLGSVSSLHNQASSSSLSRE